MFSTVVILGSFHCFSDAFKRLLTIHRDTLGPIASEWRASTGQLEFFLSGGSIDGCFREMTALCCGIELFLQELWRTETQVEDVEASAFAYDKWRDGDCESSTVKFKLVEIVEMFVNVKNMRDATRTGRLDHFKHSISIAIPYAAATGGDHYVRLYTDFLLQLETCSDYTLALLPDLLFVDHGSIYIGNDLACEYLNLYLRKGVKVFSNAHQWATATAKRARQLHHLKPDFGGGTGVSVAE